MRGPVSIASAFDSLADGLDFLIICRIKRYVLSSLVIVFSYLPTVYGQTTTPSLTWEESYFLSNADISTPQNLVIAIDTDSQGYVYYLTFGAGVFQIDPTDGSKKIIIKDLPEEDGLLNGPLDLVIDNNDIIHIADSGSKLIKRFNLSGDPLTPIGSGSGGDGKNEFWQPTGLAVDQDNNLYIVDAYRGEESAVTERYFLKIYYSSGAFKSFQGTSEKPLYEPYRVAANEEFIIISHAVNDGEVVVYTRDFQYVMTLSNIGSPGSIIIDNTGFVYAIDYADNIDFSKVLAFETLGNSDFIELFIGIQSGIENEEMVIQVFDPQLKYVKTFNDAPNEDNIQLPLDLAIDNCSSFFIDDGRLKGVSFDFDLEIFTKSPSNDNINPQAICVSSGTEFELINGKVSISVEDIDNGSTDNCGIASMTVSPETFTTAGDHEVTLTVTDTSGISDTCTTTITILGPDAALELTCPGPQEGQLDENCQFIVPNYTDLGEPSDSNADVSQSPAPGTIIDADTNIILTATLDGESVSCEFQLNLVDNTPPVMECFTNITGVYDSSKGFELLDYTGSISAADNCDSDVVITQDPPGGTLIYEDESIITFTATDAGGNYSTCKVDVLLTDVPETLRFTACPENQEGNLDANCQFVIPDYTQVAETNYPEAEITQDPPPGKLVEGKSSIVVMLTATLGDEMVKCRVPLHLIDLLPPEIVCPGDQVKSYDPAVGYVIPDFSSLAQGRDNCGELIFSQDPPEGTVVFGDTPIQLNFRDPSVNWTFCNFQLILEEIEEPTFDCPDPEALVPQELNAECRVEAQDYSDLLSSFTGFENDPHLVQTEVQDGNVLHVTIEVYDGEGRAFVGECSFDIPLLDTTPPQINCPASTINLTPEEDGKYILPDFGDRVSDTCDSNLEFAQDPPPGEITTGGTVTLTAVDDSGNTSETCSFEVVLLQEGEPSFDCFEFDAQPQIAVNEDCSFGDPDFLHLVSNFQNFQNAPLLLQSLQLNGQMLHVNIKVYDGEQKEEFLVGDCSFEIQLTENIPPQAECVQEISVSLDENGSGKITPEDIDNGSTDGCGIMAYELSRDTFTSADVQNSPIEVELTVTDVYGNPDTCTVLVTVKPYEPAEPEPVRCVTSISLQLGANGEARLDPEQLYEGELGVGGTVSVDKEIFTCADLGVQTVNLQYSGNSTGSCSIEVTVVDETAPTPQVKDIEISLDENGAASISPEDLDNGSTDNCGTAELQFTVDQMTFGCSDVGTNSVAFTVTDVSGNMATVNANIFVKDQFNYCTVDPVVPPEERFVILFPNPSRGMVQIATSTDILLNWVEIFDNRGRFLDARELSIDPSTKTYHLDLRNYQTGVYTLRLFTPEREYIRRAIITTF